MTTKIIQMLLLSFSIAILALIFRIKIKPRIFKRVPLVKYNPTFIFILAFAVIAVFYYQVFAKPQFAFYLSVCFLYITFLRLLFKRSDKVLPVEQGKVPLYQEKCWANLYQKKWYRRVGSRYRYPIARFALYDTFMIVKFSWHQLYLQYTEIDKVELGDIQRGMHPLFIYYHYNNESDYMVLHLKNALQAKSIIESKMQF